MVSIFYLDYRECTEHRLLVEIGTVDLCVDWAALLCRNHLCIQGQNLNFKCNAPTLSEPRNPNTVTHSVGYIAIKIF